LSSQRVPLLAGSGGSWSIVRVVEHGISLSTTVDATCAGDAASV